MNGQSRQLTAIVAGGSSGIGLSTVRIFLKKGVRVVFADINESLGAKVQEEFRAKGADATFVPIDITNDASIKACLEQAVKILGVIDMAVNTAGITGPTVLCHELTDEQFNKVIKVDLEGCWRFSKAMITYFRAQEPRLVRDDSAEAEAWQPVYQRGSLVNFASSIATVAQPYLSVYCAAKAGVVLLSKSMALENAVLGIRINTISPGLTYTPLMRADPNFDFERAKRDYLTDQPVGRFGHPDEIAAGAVFTAMDTASFATGSDWGPDGAYQVA